MKYLLKSLQNKGKIVYEYNPLRNLQRATDYEGVPAGTLTDFITSANKIGLNFDLTHPVDIICQPSYDGSVNLILNDNKNTPKLINTRFSPLQNNTYQIVDRSGEHDTNIYNEETFNINTSLYKRIEKMPTITLQNVLSGGNLKVGNYVFYIKYADADDNETDFAAESGVVSCFMGIDGSPISVNGGYLDQNSSKMVQLKITNVDNAYDYIKVYYTRATSGVDANAIKTAHRILQKYPVMGKTTYITITGDENVQDLPLADLNLKYFIASTVKTQTECQNRLFFGNLTQESVNIEDLQDASLRIIPYYGATQSEKLIGKLTPTYKDYSIAKNKYMYYNTKNIYNYVGYWPEEIYRFGIVYIMANGTLSPVFNVLGMQEAFSNIHETRIAYDHIPLNKNEERSKLVISESDYSIQFDHIDNNQQNLDQANINKRVEANSYNAKGVIRMPSIWFTGGERSLLAINFYMPEDLITYLKTKYQIQGWFFVRQKRIPTILAQGWTLPIDRGASVPCVYDELNTPKVEGFLDKNRIVTHTYQTRLHKTVEQVGTCAMICPEFEMHQAHYNVLFTGAQFKVKAIAKSSTEYYNRQSVSKRLYGVDGLAEIKGDLFEDAKIAAIPDSAPIVVVDDHRFRAHVGEMVDPLKFRYIDTELKENESYNYVRGVYGPYLGVVGSLNYATLYNIYIPDYNVSLMPMYFKIRYEDYSYYQTISDRYSIYDYNKEATFRCFRGDCFQCNFTHRLNRNFQDDAAPTNDIIIEPKTWKDNYDIHDKDKSMLINRGDLNAVMMGSWYTVPVWSSRNLSLRANDLSYPSEEGEFGHPRTFYPLSSISADGQSKIPESSVLNAGFSVSGGERWNYTLPSAPYYKDTFQTRIAYSDLVVGDAFRNGYRVFNSQSYRDYPRIYGGLMKLVEKNGNLVAVFEHGICLIAVNERTVAGDGAGGPVYINTSKILPENPEVISDTYGSQWADSVIKTPNYVYGVDTVAKAIWRTDGRSIQLLSDLRLTRFLNENISLSETEFTPIIGIRNVKTHYNAFKQDIMFTFYDNTKGPNEVAWNICYNEKLNKFVTFYSWIPSFSVNIDNMFFSFDRDTSKFYTKLSTSVHGNPEAYGVTLTQKDPNDTKPTVIYYKDGKTSEFELHIDDSALLNYDNQVHTFKLKMDPWGFHKYFEISDNTLKIKKGAYDELSILAKDNENQIYLKIEGDVSITQENKPIPFETYTNIIALRLNVPDDQLPTTAFYKHGQAGIFDDCEPIKPTFWYGKQHPFEFEVVVNDSPSIHKIFNNIQLLSNKAEPESFHYEVVGEVYDWAWDKKNMYYRQEATKCLLQNMGSNITYDYKYLEDVPNIPEQLKTNNETFTKSTMFPLAYTRIDKLNEVKDTYGIVNEVYDSWARIQKDDRRDYMHLSGAELVYDKLLNEYKVWNHSQAVNLKKEGRLRGNMDYKEDMWDIQINPIIFVQQNEAEWKNKVPPIYIVGTLPQDIVQPKLSIKPNGTIKELEESEIPNETYGKGKWSSRKETKLRDKYIKIRVRYSGKDLALINALLTDYTVSYG